jgi:hypothetical protein
MEPATLHRRTGLAATLAALAARLEAVLTRGEPGPGEHDAWGGFSPEQRRTGEFLLLSVVRVARQSGNLVSESAVLEQTGRGTVRLRFSVAASEGVSVPYAFEIDSSGRYRRVDPDEPPPERKGAGIAWRRRRPGGEPWRAPITEKALSQLRRLRG